MRHRVYKHVRGNAVGYLALFVALGGTGMAATQLPANSVGTAQLVNGAVTGQKVAGNTLTGANIKLSTLGAVPDARRLGGRRPTSFQSRVTGSCVGNQAIAQIAAAGTVTCQPTVSSVTAGTDLLGGGRSGDLTLSADETKLQHRLSGGCAAGQALQSIAQDGTPMCGAFGNGTITSVTAGTGLAGGGSSGSVAMSVADGGIGTSQLADGSVTTSKFASGAEAPNAAELGGLGPSSFVSGTGKLLDSGRVDTGTSRILISDSIVTVTANCNSGDSRAEVQISSPGQYSFGAQSGRLGFTGGIESGGTTVTIGAATFAGNQLDMGTFYVDTSSSGNNRHLAGSFMALGQCTFWATALSASD